MGMWAWKKKLEKTILRDRPEEIVSSKIKRPMYKNNPWASWHFGHEGLVEPYAIYCAPVMRPRGRKSLFSPLLAPTASSKSLLSSHADIQLHFSLQLNRLEKLVLVQTINTLTSPFFSILDKPKKSCQEALLKAAALALTTCFWSSFPVNQEEHTLYKKKIKKVIKI